MEITADGAVGLAWFLVLVPLALVGLGYLLGSWAEARDADRDRDDEAYAQLRRRNPAFYAQVMAAKRR